MASAQVLPNSAVSSRKQEHLEAGKRRLEEFRSSRKQKASGRTRRSAVPLQPSIADTVASDNQISDGHAVIDSAGSGTPSNIDNPISNDGQNIYNQTHGSSDDLQIQRTPDPYVVNDESSPSSYLPLTFAEQKEPQSSKASGLIYPISADLSKNKAEQNGGYGMMSREGRSWVAASTDQYDNYGHFATKDSDQQDGPSNVSEGSTEANISSLPHASHFGQSPHVNSDFNKQVVSDWRERKPIYDNLRSFQSVAVEDSHTLPKSSNFGDRASSSQAPSQSDTHETFPRRSRPSFLDSLNIPKPSSSTSVFPHSQPQPDPYQSFSQNGSLDSHLEDVNSRNNYSDAPYQEKNPFLNQEKYADLQKKPNEDFSTLEQHIEDLTQEKFSLQRALEASKTLAESLAAENSSLTESYNQQGGAVSQLKTDIQSLQAEISTLLAEHESIRIQYVNAQLECNAADERAKLLASEVIGLEEKALRLRSNELKLGKELEKSNAEISSCKKKILRLEREQQDLKMTIDALQEEKKLLQSKLRKASSSGQINDNVDLKSKINVSTSTYDLEVAHGGNLPSSSAPITEETDPSASYSPDANILQLLQQSGAFGLDSSAMVVPPDQVQMIQNINVLLSELMVEREQLTQGLVAEISASSKLKDLNKELTKRLETQTQRLELLTSQTMVKENLAARPLPDGQNVQENMAYADEGDEVVERVLGWIMKLFPGGPSKRRTSKLL